MFGRKPKKHGLYYLLPGMTRANREKRKKFFFYAMLVGTLAAAGVAAIVWFSNQPPGR